MTDEFAFLKGLKQTRLELFHPIYSVLLHNHLPLLRIITISEEKLKEYINDRLGRKLKSRSSFGNGNENQKELDQISESLEWIAVIIRQFI